MIENIVNSNYIKQKVISNIERNLNISQTETESITRHIKYLINEYMHEFSKQPRDTNKINEIFEELISYHRFPSFNNLFFENINRCVHKASSPITNTPENIHKKLKLTESTSKPVIKNDVFLPSINIDKEKLLEW